MGRPPSRRKGACGPDGRRSRYARSAARQPAHWIRLPRLRLARPQAHLIVRILRERRQGGLLGGHHKRTTPEFFAAHSVSELGSWSDDFDLENEGRLTHPMVYDPQIDHYVPIDWDEAFALIGAALRSAAGPQYGGVLHLRPHLERGGLPLPAVRARIRHQQFPRLLEHVPRGDQRRTAASDRRRQGHGPARRFRPLPTRSSSSATTPAPTTRG